MIRRIGAIMVLLLLALTVQAEEKERPAQSYSFQLQDTAGPLAAGQQVNVLLEVLEGGMEGSTTVFAERHQATVGKEGRVTVQLGKGQKEKGDLDLVAWMQAQHSIRITAGAGQFASMNEVSLISEAEPRVWLAQSDKINTVLMVILVIWAGIIVYLLATQRKVKRLENEIQRLKQEVGEKG